MPPTNWRLLFIISLAHHRARSPPEPPLTPHPHPPPLAMLDRAVARLIQPLIKVLAGFLQRAGFSASQIILAFS